MESVLCLAQFSSIYVHKEEQCQAVLGLLENEECSYITITKYYQ